MKKSLKVLSLSLLLAAPVTLTLPAQAQQVSVEPGTQVWQQVQQQFPVLRLAEVTTPGIVEEAVVAELTEDQAFQAYAQSDYSYWDAQILANYWGYSVSDAKSYIGRKLSYGPLTKALLEQRMLDARLKALATADDLKYFFDAGYNYDDAEALADYWGEGAPWQSKVRIERNIIMGNNDSVRRDLRAAKDGRY